MGKEIQYFSYAGIETRGFFAHDKNRKEQEKDNQYAFERI